MVWVLRFEHLMEFSKSGGNMPCLFNNRGAANNCKEGFGWHQM